MRKRVAIVQTGRLGDLWFVVPLADYLTDRNYEVEVWYDEIYGRPFECFPSVISRPVRFNRFFSDATVGQRAVQSAMQQLTLLILVALKRRRIIWNQIYPLRLDAYVRAVPYPEFWYRHFPDANFRRARTTLGLANDRTILYFTNSVSLGIRGVNAFTPWLEQNLHVLAERTGYRIVYVAPPGEPDHPVHDTWRGTLVEYQSLIARCGLVFGISTSAHVLAQLLGKPVVACYKNRSRVIDSIGAETARLYPGDVLGENDLASILTNLAA